MFDYLEFFFKPLSEANLALSAGGGTDSFKSLPDSEPHGFMIAPNGKFAVVKSIYGHETVSDEEFQTSVHNIIESGGIRMASPSVDEFDTYIAEYLPTKATNKAKKTAKDLAAHYQRNIKFEKMFTDDDLKNYSTVREDKPARTPDGTDSFASLPQYDPYGFVVAPNGAFAVVVDWGGHDEAAKETFHRTMFSIVKDGGIRIAASKFGEGDMYMAEYLPTKATSRAKKTAKDLADHYQRHLQFDKLNIGPNDLENINEDLCW